MLATIAYAVADTPTPPRPTLFLNTSTSLTVGWTPPATPTQYQLHLEARPSLFFGVHAGLVATRAAGAPVFSVDGAVWETFKERGATSSATASSS